VAAVLGVCRDRQAYEGEAAARLEALAEDALRSGNCDNVHYPFRLRRLPNGLLQLDPSPLWDAIIDDLADAIPATTMALRFHRGLARALVEAAERIASRAKIRINTVALSGGSFQNRILFESVVSTLRKAGFDVLTHAEVPANDGGLALGQAAIGAALMIGAAAHANEGTKKCV
jgi:hydrogenase maturation protein HypF